MEEIVELKSESEWREAFPCLKELRPELKLEDLLTRRESLLSRDYHLYGIVREGRVVCVGGYVLQPHLERDDEFWLHDLATLPQERSKGYGLLMMNHLEQMAQSHGCKRMVVHTRAGRKRAQSFYSNKAGFEEYALVYKKEIRS